MGSFIYLSRLLPELEPLKCQTRLIYLSSADDGKKKKVIAWTKYSTKSERSCLALLENVMDYWVLSYHYQDVNP